MKAKLLLSVLLLVAIEPPALSARDKSRANARDRSGHSLDAIGEEPATASVPAGSSNVSTDAKQALRDYDSAMIAITQSFSATLAAIAEAAKRGELSSDQAKEMSVQQYQLTYMKFELVSLWREIQERDLANRSDTEESPDVRPESEVVVVALPFLPVQLSPSLAKYLALTSSQVDAIQRVMVKERQTLEPLLAELRGAREKLLAMGSAHANEKELSALAATEASVLAKVIVANVRLQSKIYKTLSPEQQKKLSSLEVQQNAVTPDSK